MVVDLIHNQLGEIEVEMGSPYIHSTGDGHVCALEVGAGLIDMEYMGLSFAYGTNRVVGPMPNGVLLTPANLTKALSTYGHQATISGGGGAPGAYGILVAGNGNRFVNEAIWSITTVPNDLSAKFQAYIQIPFTPRNVWVVVDSNGAKALGTPGTTWNATNMQAASTSDVAPYLESSMVAYSSTIAGLAQQMQISPISLQATIDRWNGMVSAGKDTDYGRTAPLNPISTPPYYASKLALEGSQGSGGIIVNTKAQVIDCQAGLMARGSSPPVPLDSQPVIPGLYAAGECAGGIFGANRGEGKIGCYTTWGRIAGINAAGGSAQP
jgi:succinate dehydrogenase/fumarate reductase flavoprotein subunit